MLITDNKDNFIGIIPRRISIIIWGILLAAVIGMFWFRIPHSPAYMLFMAILAGAVFLLTQWKPCWALFITILFLPGITTLSNTVFSTSAEYVVPGWIESIITFLQTHAGLFSREITMGVFGPASLIPASALVMGIWLRALRLRQTPAPNPVRIPILIFIALSILSAIAAIWRYSDFWPIYNNPYFEQVINTQGTPASEAFEKILWTMMNYITGPLLMLAVCQTSWECQQEGNEAYDTRKWIVRWILLPLFLGSILPIGIGFFQTENIWFGANKVYVWPWVKRINATFFDPNALGSFIVLYISWAVAGIGLLVSLKKRQALIGCIAGIGIIAASTMLNKLYPQLPELKVLYFGLVVGMGLMLVLRWWYAAFGCIVGMLSIQASMYLLVHSGSRIAILGIVIIVFAAIFFTFTYFLQKVKIRFSPRMFRYATAALLVLYLAAGLWLFYAGAPKMVELLGKRKDIPETSLFNRIKKMPWGSAKGFYKQIIYDRGPYAAIAVKMIQDAPLTGVGPGCFVVELHNWKKISDVVIYVPDTACNYYLQIAAEQGLIALLAILFFYILWWRHWWQVWQKEWARIYWLMVGAGMASFMTIFIFGMHTLAHEIQCLFWIFLSQPLLVITNKEKEYTYKPSRYHGLLILAIVAVYFSFSITRLSLDKQRERFGWHKLSGFYGWERWGSTAPRMRYTQSKAEANLEVNGLEFRQPFACFHPDITTNPVSVTLSLDRFTTNLVVADHEWREFIAPLPYATLGENVRYSIEVDRTWSPKEFNITNDTRRLGVVLQDHKWKETSGMYSPMKWKDDETRMANQLFKWGSKDIRRLVYSPQNYVSFPLLIAHPDATQRPVQVSIQINDTTVSNFIWNYTSWHDIVLRTTHLDQTSLYKKSFSLGVTVDRTWVPEEYGIDDVRKLGAAIGTISTSRELGILQANQWADGTRYRRAGKEAYWIHTADDAGNVTVHFLLEHPDMEKDPVTWELYADGSKVAERSISKPGWYSITGRSEPGKKMNLHAGVDRTYTEETQGTEGTREFGFGLAEKLSEAALEHFGWHAIRGFYGWEKGDADAVRMRYTAREAETAVRIRGLEYEQKWACRHPDVTAFPVRVQMELGRYSTNVVVDDQEWHTFRVNVPADKLGQDMPFKIEVSRAWRPEDYGVAGDDRELGIQLQQSTWDDAAGLYKTETWSQDGSIMAGKPYRWSGQEAQLLVENPGAYLTIPLLVAHPDVTQQPVRLSITLNGTVVSNMTWSNPGWHEVVLYSKQDAMADGYKKTVSVGITADRTWKPTDYGINDIRVLGFAVGTIVPGSTAGIFEEKDWPDGTGYSWAGQDAYWLQTADNKGNVTVYFLIDHTDVEENPVSWELYAAGRLVSEQTIRRPGWYSITGHAGPGEELLMHARVDRTFSTQKYGGDGSRNRGFGLAAEMPESVREGFVWNTTHGFYRWEKSVGDTARTRYTAKQAQTAIRSHGLEYIQKWACRHPDIPSLPVQVSMSLGSYSTNIVVKDTDWHTFRAPLPIEELGKDVAFKIEVNRTWKQTGTGAAAGTRECGLLLQEPVWQAASGLHPPDTWPQDGSRMAGRQYRWGGSEAEVLIEYPEEFLAVPLLIESPDPSGKPVQVRITLNGVVVSNSAWNYTGWHELLLQTRDGSAITGNRKPMHLGIAVDRVRTTKDTDGTDTQERGFAIGTIKGVRDQGFYDAEQLADGSQYRWAGLQADWVQKVDADNNLTINFLLDHKDITSKPVKWSLQVNGTLIMERTFDQPGWYQVCIPAAAGQDNYLRATVNREYLPEAFGLNDTRKLGFGIAQAIPGKPHRRFDIPGSDGFYGWEQSEINAKRVRYTEQVAEQTLNCRGLEFIQRWACRHPDITSSPVRVSMRLGQYSTNSIIQDSAWHTFRARIPVEKLGKDMPFKLEVNRTWRQGNKGDRALGVLLQEAEWIDTTGLYDEDIWAGDGSIMAGKPYRWSGKEAHILVDNPGEYLSVPVLIAHPDVTQKPVRISMTINSTTISNFTWRAPAWHTILVQAKQYGATSQYHNSFSLGIAVDRTWNPKDYGVDDNRTLGAAVGAIVTGNEIGILQENQWTDGTRYKWAGQDAYWKTRADEAGNVTVHFLLDHPGMETEPVTWELFADGKKVAERTISRPGWYSITGRSMPGKQATMHARVDRTFTTDAYGGDETLERGFGLADEIPGEAREKFEWNASRGLYGWEKWGADAARMRYTAKKAETVIRADGMEFIQNWVCRHPDIAKNPVQVRMSLGHYSTNLVVNNNEWHTFRTQVSLEELGKDLPLKVTVSRAWRPDEYGTAGDNRELGLLLQVPSWDISRGLYSQDIWPPDGSSMAGKPYRWGGKTMQVLIHDPGEYLALPLLIAHPDANQTPVEVAIRLNDSVVTNFTWNNPSWQKIIMATPQAYRTNQNTKTLYMTISVDRTWQPKEYGAEDPRVLGAAIGPIEKVREHGFYDEEQLEDGTRYRWAGKEALWEQKAGPDGKLIFHYLVNHRDMVLSPVVWTLYVNKHQIVEKYLAKPGWNSEIIHVSPGETCAVRAQVNRTYSPTDYGIDDNRELGFAIKTQ